MKYLINKAKTFKPKSKPKASKNDTDSKNETVIEKDESTKTEDETSKKDTEERGSDGMLFSILTLSSIYTHFNTLKKKIQENILGKCEIAQN